MNNVLMRKIVVTLQYQPLTLRESEVATVIVRVPITNRSAVLFQGDDGAGVQWDPGTQFELKRVNLAEVRVKGRPGDLVVLAGGTW